MTPSQRLIYTKSTQIDRIDFINHWIDLLHSGLTPTKAYFQTEQEYLDIIGRNRFTSYESFRTMVNGAYTANKMQPPKFRDIEKGYIPPKLKRASSFGLLPIRANGLLPIELYRTAQ